ncbi:uncharacterized protein [Ambystoma mexicanum]|uniref:uncharacterized protein n=1 Tax=Ambystoma mexicanum TaxID=8296 RepID=UPI0037E8184B
MESSNPEHSGDACATKPAQPAQQNWILESEDIKRKQRQEISNLQEALEKADEENIQLLRENSCLKVHNKSLQQVSSHSEKLLEELETMKHGLTVNTKTIQDLEAQKKELEKKKSHLEQQVEELSAQIFECSEDNKILQEELKMLKIMVPELEEKLQTSRLEVKENEELYKKKECYMEVMATTIKEYSSIIEVMHNKICSLNDQLEKAQQELALIKMDDHGVERPTSPPSSGSLMYEIVQAELEKKLLKTHLDNERRRNRLFGFRLLLFMVSRLLGFCQKVILLVVFLVVFLALSLFYVHLVNPSFLKQKVFNKSTWMMFQQAVSPWLTLHTDGLMPM